MCEGGEIPLCREKGCSMHASPQAAQHGSDPLCTASILGACLNRQLMSELLPAPCAPHHAAARPRFDFYGEAAQHQRQAVAVAHLHVPEVHLRSRASKRSRH